MWPLDDTEIPITISVIWAIRPEFLMNDDEFYYQSKRLNDPSLESLDYNEIPLTHTTMETR